mgnify:FL=1
MYLRRGYRRNLDGLGLIVEFEQQKSREKDSLCFEIKQIDSIFSEEIARHNADVICLQEVDHFMFLRKSLASLGYVGHFTPKPDSPCLYLTNNSGPDG